MGSSSEKKKKSRSEKTRRKSGSSSSSSKQSKKTKKSKLKTGESRKRKASEMLSTDTMMMSDSTTTPMRSSLSESSYSSATKRVKFADESVSDMKFSLLSKYRDKSTEIPPVKGLLSLSVGRKRNIGSMDEDSSEMDRNKEIHCLFRALPGFDLRWLNGQKIAIPKQANPGNVAHTFQCNINGTLMMFDLMEMPIDDCFVSVMPEGNSLSARPIVRHFQILPNPVKTRALNNKAQTESGDHHSSSNNS